MVEHYPENEDTLKISELYNFCIDILAHAEIDCEVTIGGNGVNCSEAATVAEGILSIIDRKAKKDDIKAQVKNLKKFYGL
jgi:hypothetical protein